MHRLAAAHPPRLRLTTTLISRSGSTPITRNEVCTKPGNRSEPSRVSCAPPSEGRRWHDAEQGQVRQGHQGQGGAAGPRACRGLRSEWAAITAVSSRLGMSSETLRKWVRQAEVDEGSSAGVTSSESAELRELRRKNRELEQTIEILKAATSFSRGSATRYAADLRVHRRTRRTGSGSYRSAARCRRTASRSPRGPTGRTAAAAPSKRALWDTAVTEILACIYEPDADGRARRSRCMAR